MSVPGHRLLQMLQGGINNVLDRTSGGPSPYLVPEEQQAVNEQRRMAMVASLLQSSGIHPRGTTSLLGNIGDALSAGQHTQQQGIEQALKARLLAAQMARYTAQQAPDLSDSGKKVNELEQSLGRKLTDKERFTIMGAGDLYKEPAQPQASDASKKIGELEASLGRPLTDKERFTMMGAGSLFESKPDELDKPLSPTDIAKLRLPDGSTPAYGMTGRQAMAEGAKAFSETELTRQSNTTAALNTLGELKNLALGPNGAFRDNGGSVVTNNVLARLANGTANAIGHLFGTEASFRRDVFNSTSQGSIGSLVRSIGEAGSLSDGDVKRAIALLPVLGAMPDTEEVTKAKFEELASIISRGANGLSVSNTLDAPGGSGIKFLGFEP